MGNPIRRGFRVAALLGICRPGCTNTIPSNQVAFANPNAARPVLGGQRRQGVHSPGFESAFQLRSDRFLELHVLGLPHIGRVHVLFQVKTAQLGGRLYIRQRFIFVGHLGMQR